MADDDADSRVDRGDAGRGSRIGPRIRSWIWGPWAWLAACVTTIAVAQAPPREKIDADALVQLELERRGERAQEFGTWRDHHGDHRIEWSDADGHLAIVIDDVGREFRVLDRLLALPIPITFSVLPGATYAMGAQLRLRGDRRRHREIWLHFPMEPSDTAARASDEALGERFATRAQTHAQRLQLLRDALDVVRTAVGVNNHMGSALTPVADAMRPLMRELARRRLLFLDSRTTAETSAFRVAVEEGVPAAERHVFLDHDPSPAAMAAALDRAIERATSEPTIAIGHPSLELVAVLQSRLGALRARKVGIYPLSEVVAHIDGRHFPRRSVRATLPSASDVGDSPSHAAKVAK